MTQPTYNHLTDNLHEVRLQACAMIMSMPDDEILAGVTIQAKKGLTKYGCTIDDNKDFDFEQYAKEEIFDLLVYTANGNVRTKNN